MQTTSTKDHIYIGKEAGKEIHEKIKNAKKSVKIVSPYLSADYLKDLVLLHKKQVEVTLVTCDKIEDSHYSDFKTQDLIKTEKIYNEKAGKLKKFLFRSFIWLFILSIISIIPYLVGLRELWLLVLILIVLSISIISLVSSKLISDYSLKYEPIFRIKVFDSHSGKNPRSTELIHSKIFVIDGEVAFLGSVNFTYSGFKTHYETTIKIEDKNAVKDISEEVERLYASHDLKAKNIQEWFGGEERRGWL